MKLLKTKSNDFRQIIIVYTTKFSNEMSFSDMETLSNEIVYQTAKLLAFLKEKKGKPIAHHQSVGAIK